MHSDYAFLLPNISRIDYCRLSQIKVVAAVEVAVGDGFHDVGLAHLDAGVKVGYGAGIRLLGGIFID